MIRYESILPRCSLSNRTIRVRVNHTYVELDSKELRTEVPLPAAKHLGHRDEPSAKGETRAAGRYIEDPGEAHHNVGDKRKILHLSTVKAIRRHTQPRSMVSRTGSGYSTLSLSKGYRALGFKVDQSTMYSCYAMSILTRLHIRGTHPRCRTSCK